MGGLNTDLHRANGFTGEVEAVRGQDRIVASFPDGAGTPTTVLVDDAAVAPAVVDAVAGLAAVAEVGPVEQAPGGPGSPARLDVVLDRQPYSAGAYAAVAAIREQARAAAGDVEVMVGGGTAEEADVRTAAARDDRVVLPLALIVVLGVLVLLRALVAPLVLLATVVLSFAAALGAGVFLFNGPFGFPGIDATVPIFSFVFLIGLGVDYNIFLMARVREEAEQHGTREGMTRGLAVTGGVITSAGIVLAGTFGALTVLPSVLLFQVGFVVALGVLIDTFVVRSLLVPALTHDLGARMWWPSRLARPTTPDAGPGRLRERASTHT